MSSTSFFQLAPSSARAGNVCAMCFLCPSKTSQTFRDFAKCGFDSLQRLHKCCFSSLLQVLSSNVIRETNSSYSGVDGGSQMLL
ncbi:hypothetical protein U1Q18_028061 [Sarracenia purpurea var. burkii]